MCRSIEAIFYMAYPQKSPLREPINFSHLHFNANIIFYFIIAINSTRRAYKTK